MKIPELHSQLTLGDESVYVVEIEEDSGRSYGVSSGMDVSDSRVILTCHDNYGNEVEIRFYPDEEEDIDY
jgi:hypothetical protein